MMRVRFSNKFDNRIITFYRIFISICLCVFIVVVGSVNAFAQEDGDEPVIYTVLTRSNLRAAPSGNGNWIATIPNGALVIPIEAEIDGYIQIVYGEYKGYIYGGCITKMESKTLEDYCNQFPDLDINRINKAYGIGKKEDVKSAFIPTEAQKVQYSDEKPITVERPNAITSEDKDAIEEINEEKIENKIENKIEEKPEEIIKAPSENVSQDEKANHIPTEVEKLTSKTDSISSYDRLAEENDIYETKYIDSVSRDTKEITGPDAKIYNENEVSIEDVGKMQSTNVSFVSNNSDSQDGVKATVFASCNMRSLPTQESSKVISIPAGAKVTVLDEGENGFLHCRYSGQEGYIFARSVDYNAESSYVGNSIETKTESGVNNNTATVLSSRKVISMTAVSSLKESEDEGNIEEEAEVKEVKVSATAVANSNDNAKETVSKEISARVNMRALPTSDSTKVLSLPIGADVEILGQASGGYSLVQYNGVKGYVLDDWIVESVEVNKLGSDAILFECTAYCACRKCCGNYSPEVTGREPHTATGTIPKEGRTIAVDPSVIRYGTSVYIEGMGTYIAEDCGGGVKGNHIDIYFESHEAAVKFGRKRLYVSVQR